MTNNDALAAFYKVVSKNLRYIVETPAFEPIENALIEANNVIHRAALTPTTAPAGEAVGVCFNESHVGVHRMVNPWPDRSIAAHNDTCVYWNEVPPATPAGLAALTKLVTDWREKGDKYLSSDEGIDRTLGAMHWLHSNQVEAALNEPVASEPVFCPPGECEYDYENNEGKTCFKCGFPQASETVCAEHGPDCNPEHNIRHTDKYRIVPAKPVCECGHAPTSHRCAFNNVSCKCTEFQPTKETNDD